MDLHIFSIASITCTLICIFQSSYARDKPTAYEMLQRYNFPIGVLPKGVTGYDLDESTGKFSAYLNGSCAFSLKGSYQLNYKPTIEGYLSRGKLSKLVGIQVKLFFIWVDIVDVDRKGDELEFSVGIAAARISVDSFVECPQCGCGLECGGGGRARILGTNRFGVFPF